MKIWRFEGSPEEFSAVASVLMTDGAANGTAKATMPASEEASKFGGKMLGRVFVTASEAKEVLTRRRLGGNMINVLKALYQAGESRVTSQELMNANSHNSDQFRGLMGAFGRRVVNTVGPDKWFFDDKWSDEQGQNTYTLPASVRHAIEELKLL